jgi:hypothetical protein
VFIADQLNKAPGDTKIATSLPKKALWSAIHDAVAPRGFVQDWSWKTLPEVKASGDAGMLSELRHKTWRPQAPSTWKLYAGKRGNPNEWLSNFDIDAVMKQYAEMHDYKDYKFFYCTSIDFAAVHEEIASVNVVKLRDAGITRLNIVFNLDKHDQGGSHWVQLFVDLKGGLCGFTDSYGSVPEPEFQDLMAKFCVQALLGYDGKTFKPEKSFRLAPVYNKVQHQRLGFACGVYSLYFGIQCLLMEPATPDKFAALCQRRVDDATVNAFRQSLFIDSGKSD